MLSKTLASFLFAKIAIYLSLSSLVLGGPGKGIPRGKKWDLHISRFYYSYILNHCFIVILGLICTITLNATYSGNVAAKHPSALVAFFISILVRRKTPEERASMMLHNTQDQSPSTSTSFGSPSIDKSSLMVQGLKVYPGGMSVFWKGSSVRRWRCAFP